MNKLKQFISNPFVVLFAGVLCFSIASLGSELSMFFVIWGGGLLAAAFFLAITD
jgi:hypothetical protein